MGSQELDSNKKDLAHLTGVQLDMCWASVQEMLIKVVEDYKLIPGTPIRYDWLITNDDVVPPEILKGLELESIDNVILIYRFSLKFQLVT